MLKLTRQLFDVLSMPLTRGPLTGIWGSWEKPARQVTAFLQRWQDSSLNLLRMGHASLLQLVQMAWYERPESWAACGYPGHRKSENNKSIANARTRPVSRRPGPRLDHPRRLTPDHDLTLEADVADRQRRRRCHQRQILSAAGYKCC
jgi:hypothetical protein